MDDDAIISIMELNGINTQSDEMERIKEKEARCGIESLDEREKIIYEALRDLDIVFSIVNPKELVAILTILNMHEEEIRRKLGKKEWKILKKCDNCNFSFDEDELELLIDVIRKIKPLVDKITDIERKRVADFKKGYITNETLNRNINNTINLDVSKRIEGRLAYERN